MPDPIFRVGDYTGFCRLAHCDAAKADGGWRMAEGEQLYSNVLSQSYAQIRCVRTSHDHIENFAYVP